MTATPAVAVIVLSWNGERYLTPCLEAVLAQNYSALEVMVVDNGSTDQSVALIQTFAPRLRLIQNDHNLGFAGGNNVGLRATTADIAILLNQDTVVQPGWLAAILETFTDPTIGIVGCKALYPDGRTIQHAGARVKPEDAFTEHIGLGQPDEGQFNHLADMDYVTGAAFAIHRRVLEQLGLLDTEYYPAYYEEIDYCYRARRAGFRVVYQPRAVFLHHELTSLPAQSYAQISAFHRNRLRFVLRQWSLAELQAFVVAERDAIGTAGRAEDLAAQARGYFEALRALRSVVNQRQTDSTLGPPLSRSEARWLFDNLQTLREQALRRMSVVIEHWVQAAEERAVPREMLAPVSHIPVLGPLITRLRAMWLAAMVRPYLIPLLQQQWEYNDYLVRVTRYMSQQATVAQRSVALWSADDVATIEQLRHNLDRVDDGS